MFTQAEAYAAYTARFSSVGIVDGQPVTYLPQAVCNRKEMQAIFGYCQTLDQVLDMMRECVGTAGPKKDVGGPFVMDQLDEDFVPVVKEPPCQISSNSKETLAALLSEGKVLFYIEH